MMITSSRRWTDLVIVGSAHEFWRENVNGRWATLVVVLFIFVWHTLVRRRISIRFRSNSLLSSSSSSSLSHNQSQFRVSSTTATSSPKSTTTSCRISDVVTDADLRKLMNNLEGVYDEEMKWDDVVDKTSNVLSYNAKSCKPKNGPLTYMSVTIFENCSPELLRDFYMDNEYRVRWDKTIVDYKQLQVDEVNGTEIGRTVKKFPLLTPREYILAWRLWEGKDKTFYCFTKECEHILAPQQRKFVRVGYFRSGWRIRKVPNRNACEVKMVHQEDAGLNVDMAKLIFAKGIWSYVCKMDAALRKYNPNSHSQSSSVATAVTLMQKVPPELDSATTISHGPGDHVSTSISSRQVAVVEGKTISRRPSKKMIANGLLLLGGVLCLSRGHSSVSAKIAMACILKKLTKHATASGQATKSS